MHLMLPNALLRLRQGFGRLIRSKTDRGIVPQIPAFPRKKYGQYFKQILPGRCIELKNEQQLISEIGKFFSRYRVIYEYYNFIYFTARVS